MIQSGLQVGPGDHRERRHRVGQQAGLSGGAGAQHIVAERAAGRRGLHRHQHRHHQDRKLDHLSLSIHTDPSRMELSFATRKRSEGYCQTTATRLPSDIMRTRTVAFLALTASGSR